MNNLQTYLNDHLAGSVGALEMLDHLIVTREDDDTRKFLAELREEIAADQDELKELLRRVGGEESGLRKAGAWLAEKFGRAKLRGGENELGFMQAMETLSLGILGKRSLWRTLAGRSEIPGLAGVDYARLEARAEAQFGKVEARAMEVAAAAFSGE